MESSVRDRVVPVGMDVVVRGLSLLRLVELCGTPCVHSEEARPVGGLPPVGGSVLVRVTAVFDDEETGRVVCIDAHLDLVSADWDRARVLGRVPTEMAAPTWIVAGHADAGAGMCRPSLPQDLGVGDVLVIPCRDDVTLHDVRFSREVHPVLPRDAGHWADARRVPPRRRRRS